MKRKKIHYDKHYEIKFWKDWLEADFVDRRKLVKQLAIVKEQPYPESLSKRMKTSIYASLLNSYFEDLENACRAKFELERQRSKNYIKTRHSQKDQWKKEGR